MFPLSPPASKYFRAASTTNERENSPSGSSNQSLKLKSQTCDLPRLLTFPVTHGGEVWSPISGLDAFENLYFLHKSSVTVSFALMPPLSLLIFIARGLTRLS